VADGAGDERLARSGVGARLRGGEPGADEVERPDVRVGEGRVERMSAAVSTTLGQAGADEDPAPVGVVGQRAAPQAEDDERHEFDDAEDTDGEVAAGEVIELPREGDVGDHAAEVEDGAGQEESPEVRRRCAAGSTSTRSARSPPAPRSPGEYAVPQPVPAPRLCVVTW
jgi:hypothetical protein